MIPEPAAPDTLVKWWVERAEQEIGQIAAKAAAYGSNSLAELGAHIARLQERTVTKPEALILGCWINVVQKIERMTDAILRGDTPDDDSIHDARVYLGMIQRIRDTGNWP